MLRRTFASLCLILVLSTIQLFGQEPRPSTGNPAQPAPAAGGSDQQAPKQAAPVADKPKPDEQQQQAQPEHHRELTPAQKKVALEMAYRQAWIELGTYYYDAGKLSEWGKLRDKYHNKLTTPDELYAANKELAAALGDKFTRYYSPKDLAKQKDRDDKELYFLGLFLEKGQDGLYRVDDIKYGTKAYSSDLRRGDVVVSIGKTKLKGLSEEEVDDLLYGKEDTEAKVTFGHDGKEETLDLTFAQPENRTVEGGLMDGKIFYLRLPDYQDMSVLMGAGNAFQAVLQLSGGELNGIVIDLRGNPGGDFKIARAVTSLFLEKGIICTKHSREGLEESEEQFRVVSPLDYMAPTVREKAAVKQLALLRKLPMVVLVNSFTASGAEVMAGALKDNDRATLVGETTWGKGTGYAYHPLYSGTLQITQMEYSTPSGFKPAGKGIAPHKVVAQPRGSEKDVQMEAALSVLADKIKNQGK
jgi:carboxyl-terminal processing protease